MSVLLGLPPDGLAKCPVTPVQFSCGEQSHDVLGDKTVGPFDFQTSLLQPVIIRLNHSGGGVLHSFLDLLLQSLSDGLVLLL